MAYPLFQGLVLAIHRWTGSPLEGGPKPPAPPQPLDTATLPSQGPTLITRIDPVLLISSLLFPNPFPAVLSIITNLARGIRWAVQQLISKGPHHRGLCLPLCTKQGWGWGLGRRAANILPGTLRFLPDLNRAGDQGLSKAKSDRKNPSVPLLSKSHRAREHL